MIVVRLPLELLLLLVAKAVVLIFDLEQVPQQAPCCCELVLLRRVLEVSVFLLDPQQVQLEGEWLYTPVQVDQVPGDQFRSLRVEVQQHQVVVSQ